MFAVLGIGLLGGVLFLSPEPPDIAGQWTGEDWGAVVLKKTTGTEYTGTYTDTFGKQPGEIQLKWSRIERRFNGTWREGDDRFGELSLRFVNNEIRGALTTDAKSKINPATPRLADLTWVRGKAAATPLSFGKDRPPSPDDNPAHTVSRVFLLRFKLASDMADDLRQILLGRPGHEAKPSANNQEITVTAPPEVMTRVQTFITVMDWPDTIARRSNYEYPRKTVMQAARSFFYACAIEDSEEVFSKLLSLQTLAELKGDTKSKHYFNYSMGEAPDAEWEKSLRADWPGKKEAIQRLVREWNRYPLKRITERDGVAIGFGVKYFCSVSLDGAPEDFYGITIEPGRTDHGTAQNSFFFSSLPPWWKWNEKKDVAPSPAPSPRN